MLDLVVPNPSQSVDHLTKIAGIGPAIARQLYDHYGEKVFNILDDNPDELMGLSGIGEAKIELIKRSWPKVKIIITILQKLKNFALNFYQAKTLYYKLGNFALDKINTNPYLLIEYLPELDFAQVDRGALESGVPKDSPKRIDAGLGYVLYQAMQHGLCGLEQTSLLGKAVMLLKLPEANIQENLRDNLKKSKLNSDVIDKITIIYLPDIYFQEQLIARQIALKLEEKNSKKIANNFDKEVFAKIKKQQDIELTQEQAEALEVILRSPFSVLTGGPGVGKTTLLKFIVSYFLNKSQTIMLAAPTGRAARKMATSSSYSAKTIHRLLEFDPITETFARDFDNQLPAKALIIDEASMVDVFLMAAIMRAASLDCQIVVVGDVDQLPSIGPGDVLNSLICSDKIPLVRLTKIHRQAENSQIIKNAYLVNTGKLPCVESSANKDFFVIDAKSEYSQLDLVLKMVQDRIPNGLNFDPIFDLQVLAPQRYGLLGTNNLNNKIQALLNPKDPKKHELVRKHHVFREGDKVIQQVNNYEHNIFNGDLGIIQKIDHKTQSCTINFEDETVRYKFAELAEVKLAYTITVHKAQGSEYPVVLIILTKQHIRSLKRNLLYTAITRGAKCVIIVNLLDSLEYAVENNIAISRNSRIKNLLIKNI